MPPNQFRSGFVPEASDGAKLTLKRHSNSRWELFYETSAGAIDIATRINSEFEVPTKPILLAEGDPNSDELVTYPLNTTATSSGFLEPRYGHIQSISLVGFNLTDIDDGDFEGFFEQLPAGFKKSPYFGFGLNYDLRDIVYAIEEIRSIRDIKILRKLTGKDPDISADRYLVSAKKFDEIRRAIRRIHDKALEVASEDKDSFSNNELLTALDPLIYPLRRRSYQKDAVSIAIGKGPEKDEWLSEADRDAVVTATKRSARALRREKPEALLELSREIEIVTIIDLIERMKILLTKNHNENTWQRFLRENPFIIRLAFNIPVMVIRDQFYVGGQRFDGGGEKISDFALKTVATGNISLVEIKTPQTGLLETRPYRGGVYAPSKELSGAVNQVLDQAYQLQRTIDSRKVNSRAYDLEAYAVQGLVVAGRDLVDEDKRKSLELFRNNQKSVDIVTFDELLTKLELLCELLGPPSSTDPDVGGDLEAEDSED